MEFEKKNFDLLNYLVLDITGESQQAKVAGDCSRVLTIEPRTNRVRVCVAVGSAGRIVHTELVQNQLVT